MDQIKIGKFIAEQRKNMNMTQLNLAEKLHVTDRAISKWENGRGMPDSSIMLDLCDILNINVNELLSGEVIDMKDYNKNAENNFVEMTKDTENTNKKYKKAKKIWLITIFLILVLALVIITYHYFYWKDLYFTAANNLYEENKLLQDAGIEIITVDNGEPEIHITDITKVIVEEKY